MIGSLTQRRRRNSYSYQKSLKHYCLPTPPMQAIEATNIILTPLDHDPVSIVSVYIPPSSDDNLFTIDLEYFSKRVVIVSSSAISMLLIALELQCKLKQRQASFFNFANILNLHIAFPDSPTRFGHNSANTIDFALIKNFYYPYTIKSINDLYSDHNPVFLNFDFKLKVESSNPRAITTNWKDFRINLNKFTEAVVATHSHASQPIVNAHRNYTPNHINQLIKHKNNLRKRYQQTLNPFYKTLCNRAQANLKKELKIYSNDTWNARLEALNTTDNSLWEAQRFLKKKRSQIPTLNCATGMAVTDPQKANLLANTIKNNFIENNRMQDNYDQDDEVVTSTTNRKYFGRFPKEEHGSGLSGYPESLRPCLDFRTHFQTNYLRYSFSPHSPHPLVSH
ncbi:putative RNA-directed DNA polymerase from transposon X-element [Trichonephila clavipes]|uniref:Putative RNA-directed DNA polymerase from transposon X-element n=1 Tax=Trichonephila clavipes TaxID=2585209 RepID=A0A8X6VRS3_TRICX|nr:putative RNA-directed DNA polymerase from transposon X-element [Trichonephila clavipes]